MTGIESVGGSATSTSVGDFLGPEDTKESFKEGSPPCQGDDSGLKRMEEEGKMTQALSLQTRKAKQRALMTEKIETLDPLIRRSRIMAFGKLDSNTFESIKILASYDVKSALFFVNCYLNGQSRAKGYVEISKHLPPKEAQRLLNRVKEERWHCPASLSLICLEEHRRKLSEKEKTLRDFKKSFSDTIHLVKLLMDLQKELPSNLLKKVHQEEMDCCLKASPPVFRQYTLLNLLKVEARAKSPLAFETLRRLRKNAGEILKEKPEYPSLTIEAWGKIIKAEATDPFLSSELEKDFSCFLETVEKYQKLHPKKAIEALKASGDESERFRAIVGLIEANHPEKEKLMEELTFLAEKDDLCELEKVTRLAKLFECLMLEKDALEAMPYLERAKSYISEIKEEDFLQRALYEILKVEFAFNLPAARDTLKQLRKVADEATVLEDKVVPLIIRAELFFLTATFS